MLTSTWTNQQALDAYPDSLSYLLLGILGFLTLTLVILMVVVCKTKSAKFKGIIIVLFGLYFLTGTYTVIYFEHRVRDIELWKNNVYLYYGTTIPVTTSKVVDFTATDETVRDYFIFTHYVDVMEIEYLYFDSGEEEVLKVFKYYGVPEINSNDSTDVSTITGHYMTGFSEFGIEDGYIPNNLKLNLVE